LVALADLCLQLSDPTLPIQLIDAALLGLYLLFLGLEPFKRLFNYQSSTLVVVDISFPFFLLDLKVDPVLLSPSTSVVLLLFKKVLGVSSQTLQFTVSPPSNEQLLLCHLVYLTVVVSTNEQLVRLARVLDLFFLLNEHSSFVDFLLDLFV